MNPILESIETLGIVPVVVLNDSNDAIPLAKALCEGGLPCAEVTFRTDAAEDSIRRMTHTYPNMLIGAGTVLTKDQVDRAVNAGAKFIVSPGINPAIVEYCMEKQIPIIPGATSPSEIEIALSYGLNILKFFPAEQFGGLKMIQALTAPYTTVRFMPTGGINAENINTYLANPKIVACGGSWMVPNKLIVSGEFDKIKDLTANAIRTVLGFQLKHIGIPCETANHAHDVANAFQNLFGWDKKEGNSSIFAGTAIEAMKTSSIGDHGHIAIETNSIERAINHLERKGFTFNENSTKTKNGQITSIYLKDTIGGFAVHLIRNI